MSSEERGKDALPPESDLILADLPAGIDRRAFTRAQNDAYQADRGIGSPTDRERHLT